MYAPNMKYFGAGLLVVLVAGTLQACHTASPQAALPAPETEQVISDSLKELYMAASMATSQSIEQQKLILRMAQKANNGKELLLVMRAAVGVFPSTVGSRQGSMESQVHSLVTNKMMRVATLDQLIDYAKSYPVDQEHTRRFVQRMFELANTSTDARVWYRIRAAAFHLKEGDLEHQAQARAEQLFER